MLKEQVGDVEGVLLEDLMPPWVSRPSAMP